VLCKSCGTQNPEANRFCGMCGALLDRRAAARRIADRRRSAGDNVVRIGGGAPDLAPEQPALPRSNELPARGDARGGEQPSPAGYAEISRVLDSEMHDAEPPETSRSRPSGDVQADAEMRAARETFAHDDPVPPPAQRDTTARGVYGPSFLGLDEPTDSAYLFDDEEPRRSARGWLLLILLLALGGFAYMQWRSGDPNTMTARAIGMIRQRMQSAPPPQATEPTAGRTDASASESGAATPPAKDEKPASDSAPIEEHSAEHGAAPAGQPPQRGAEKGKGAEAQQKETPPSRSPADKSPEEKSKPKPEAAARSEERGAAEEEAATSKARGGPAEAGTSVEDELVARGQNYLYGKGVRRNCDQALMLLKAAASHGNPKASSQLGAMYATGNCVALDRPTAYRWFSAAANAEPGNIYVERNRTMIWREMSADERQRAR